MIQASYQTVTRQISAMIRLPNSLPAINWRTYDWIIVPLLAFLVSRAAVFAAAIIGDVMLPADFFKSPLVAAAIPDYPQKRVEALG